MSSLVQKYNKAKWEVRKPRLNHTAGVQQINEPESGTANEAKVMAIADTGCSYWVLRRTAWAVQRREGECGVDNVAEADYNIVGAEERGGNC